MKKYEDILNETKKYNVTWEVSFDNGYKNIDNVVMAKDEKEAEKVSEKLLNKYLDKTSNIRSVDEIELYSVEVYDSRTMYDIKVNSFKEYKPS
jgi:cupin superfamily acireductone dioxygenase involved in methionine salvage